MEEEKWIALSLRDLGNLVILNWLRIKSSIRNMLHWEPVHQQAFEKTKHLIACKVVMTHSYLELPFETYTDASDYWLGATRVQVIFIKKLSSTQHWYTITVKELFSIIYTLKTFKGIFGPTDQGVHWPQESSTKCPGSWYWLVNEVKMLTRSVQTWNGASRHNQH